MRVLNAGLEGLVVPSILALQLVIPVVVLWDTLQSGVRLVDVAR